MPRKIGSFRFGDANKPVLVFQRAIDALLVLFEMIEGNYASAKTDANQLMSAADGEHGDRVGANERGKAFEHGRIVEIKIAERSAQNNRVRLKLLGCGGN